MKTFLLNAYLFLLILFCFQLNITFNDKTEVFEYPSFESVDISFKTDSKRRDQEDEGTQEDVNPASNNSKQQSSIFKTNSSVGSSGTRIFSCLTIDELHTIKGITHTPELKMMMSILYFGFPNKLY